MSTDGTKKLQTVSAAMIDLHRRLVRKSMAKPSVTPFYDKAFLPMIVMVLD